MHCNHLLYTTHLLCMYIVHFTLLISHIHTLTYTSCNHSCAFLPIQERENTGKKWQVQAAEWRESLGCTGSLAQVKPWSSLPGKEFRGISRTARNLEIMDLVCLQMVGTEETKKIMKKPLHEREKILTSALADTVVDLSQNPQRRAYSNAAGVAKCMCTGSVLYSYALDRLIIPFERMILQGHSQALSIPSSMTPKSLQELAAMGIFLPSLGHIIMALLVSTGIESTWIAGSENVGKPHIMFHINRQCLRVALLFICISFLFPHPCRFACDKVVVVVSSE